MMKKISLLLIFILSINYSSFAQVLWNGCQKDDIMDHAWRVVGDTNLKSTFTAPNRGRDATNWEDVWNGKYPTDYSYTLLDDPLNLTGEELEIVERMFSNNFEEFDKNKVVVKVEHIEEEEFLITTFIGFNPDPNSQSCRYSGVSSSTIFEVDNTHNKMKAIKHLQEQREIDSTNITQPDASHLSRSYDRKSTKKYGFEDKGNKEITSFDYDMVWTFSENLAAVKKDGFWGYINAKGETIIPLKYDRAWSFINGEAKVESNGKWYFIDKSGKCTFNCQ